MLFNPEGRFLSFWDGWMLIVIMYSCTTSAYFTCFDQPDIGWIIAIDLFITVCFTFDILFNLCRQFRDLDGTFVRQHRLIIAKYAKSGWLFLDIIATFPLQFFVGDNILVIKLIRMIRLPRILKIFNVQKFKKNLQYFVTGNTRSQRIMSQITVRKVYSIIRLIMITIILIYFISCIYYFGV